MIDGNDSLRPGAGRVLRDQWLVCPLPFYPGNLSVTSIRNIMPSVGPNAPVFCQYLVPVPGESRGIHFLLVMIHGGKNWRKMDRGKPHGGESLTQICRGGLMVGGKVGRKGQISSLKPLVSLSFSYRYLLGK